MLEELPQWIQDLENWQADSEVMSLVPETSSTGKSNENRGEGYEPWDFSEEISSPKDVVESTSFWKRSVEREEMEVDAYFGNASPFTIFDPSANVDLSCQRKQDTRAP